MKTTVIYLLILGLLCLGTCRNEDPGQREPASGSVAPSEAVGGFVHIVFNWPGDDFASRQQLEIRDKIARTIEERGIGKVTRLESGMGKMKIVVKVGHKEKARSEIGEIIRKVAPDMKSYIR